jgi:hypothetical protein
MLRKRKNILGGAGRLTLYVRYAFFSQVGQNGSTLGRISDPRHDDGEEV